MPVTLMILSRDRAQLDPDKTIQYLSAHQLLPVGIEVDYSVSAHWLENIELLGETWYLLTLHGDIANAAGAEALMLDADVYLMVLEDSLDWRRCNQLGLEVGASLDARTWHSTGRTQVEELHGWTFSYNGVPAENLNAFLVEPEESEGPETEAQ